MKKIIYFICALCFITLCVGMSSDNGSVCDSANGRCCASTKANDLTPSIEQKQNELCSLAVNKETSGLSSIAAKSAYLADYATGTLIYASNENERLPIASMTKIMLCNLIFDAVDANELSLDEEITVSNRASSFGGSQVFLREGEKYVAKELVKSIIVASANDASVAMAERLFGSEDACVDKMNTEAKKMGLKNTLFSNCTGLPKPTQYSSAKDVCAMLTRLVDHKEYFEFSSVWLDKILHADGKETVLTNTNKLVRFYKGCDGGKTGFTSEAQFCLAAMAKRGDLRLVSVVVGSEGSKERFGDVSKMFDYGFANYCSKVLVDKNIQLEENVSVLRGKKENVAVAPKVNYSIFSGKNEESNYIVEFTPYGAVEAPIKSGDEVGELVVYRNNVEIGRVKAVAAESVERLSWLDAAKRTVKNWRIG